MYHTMQIDYCCFFNFQVLLMSKQIEPGELDFLLRFPATPNVISPVDFLSHQCWGGIKALSNMEQFRDLDKDIEVWSYLCHSHNYITAIRLAFTLVQMA